MIVRPFILSFIVLFFSFQILGQQGQTPELLPQPSEALPCSTVLRYIDDAVMRAGRAKSSLFVVVRAKNSKAAKLTAIRARHLKNYFRFYRIKKVEVLGDISDGRSNILDLFLNGDLLYSLPIGRRETFAWSRGC